MNERTGQKLSSRKNSLSIIYQYTEKYQTVEIVSSTSRSHNTPLWVSVRFSLKRMCTPYCQSSGEFPNPVAEDEAWDKKALEMGGGNSHFSRGQASLDLTVIGGAGKTIDSGLPGWKQHQGLVPAYGERLGAQRCG